MSHSLLPPDLAGDGRVAYQGYWISEHRETEVSGEGGIRKSREIWVRDLSGEERRWEMDDRRFGALEGHPIGVLAYQPADGEGVLLGMVNYHTGEAQLLPRRRSGFGWKVWLGFFALLLLVEGGDPWRMYAWLSGFLLLTGTTVYSALADARLAERDHRRLAFLKECELFAPIVRGGPRC